MSMDLLSLVLLLGGGSTLGLVGLLMLFVHRGEMELAARATDLLRQGAAPVQVRQQFIAEGVDLETTAKAVRWAETQAIAALANDLLSRGASEEEVRGQLTARGLDQKSATEIARAAAHPSWVRRHPSASVLLGIPLLLIGVAALVGAIILLFAVKAGVVDHLPVGPEDVRDVADNVFDKTIYRVRESIRDELGQWAAILGALVGAVFVASAIVLSGWRVALGFGTITVVVGIGMLAFGFINLEEPSLRFCAPLGFFVSLAGAMVVWVGIELSWRMDFSSRLRPKCPKNGGERDGSPGTSKTGPRSMRTLDRSGRPGRDDLDR